MRKSFNKRHGNFPRDTVNLSALRKTAEFLDAARAIVPDMLARESAKIIAFKTGATPRTVEGWKRGDHMPGLEHIGALIEAYPEFAAFMRAFATRALEPDFFDEAGAVTAFVNAHVRNGRR